MKLFELYQQNTLQGTNNLKRISEAVEHKTGAVITVGNTQVKLGINSARYVFSLYETAVANGTSEQFLEGLANLNPTMVMENDNTMRHIVSKFKHEVKNFLAGQELSDDLYHALYDYYSDHGEMPYGTMKGRDGDPYEWVHMRFDQDVHDYTGGGNPDIPALPAATMPSMPRQESMYESKKAKMKEGSRPVTGSAHDKLVGAISSRMSDTPQPRRAPKDDAEAASWARMEKDKLAMKKAVADKKVKEGWDDMMADVRARADKETPGATGKFDRKSTGTGTVYSRKYNADSGQSIEPKKDAEGKSPVKRSRGRPSAAASSTEGGTSFADYNSWYHKSKRTHSERKIVGSRAGAVAVVPKGKKYLVVGNWENDSGMLFDKPNEMLSLEDLKAFKSAKGRPKKIREWIETLRFVSEGETTKTATGIKHSAKGKYGASEEEEKEPESLNKSLTSKLDKSMGIKHDHGNKKK
jgi:hypothetical protein